MKVGYARILQQISQGSATSQVAAHSSCCYFYGCPQVSAWGGASLPFPFSAPPHPPNRLNYTTVLGMGPLPRIILSVPAK